MYFSLFFLVVTGHSFFSTLSVRLAARCRTPVLVPSSSGLVVPSSSPSSYICRLLGVLSSPVVAFNLLRRRFSSCKLLVASLRLACRWLAILPLFGIISWVGSWQPRLYICRGSWCVVDNCATERLKWFILFWLQLRNIMDPALAVRELAVFGCSLKSLSSSSLKYYLISRVCSKLPKDSLLRTLLFFIRAIVIFWLFDSVRFLFTSRLLKSFFPGKSES